MRDATYHLIAWLFDVFLWGGELAGEENLPDRGPAVFVSNHMGALGPIAVAASIPLRLYPWVIGDMIDEQKAAAYLNMDFVEKQLHLRPPISMAVSKALSRVSVPLLRSAGCIGVRQGEALLDTYRQSVDLLFEGKCLVIFPEDPEGPIDPLYQMTPFKKGFARLGELFHERTGQSLRFYPLAVHAELSRVKVGKPVLFNPLNPVINERSRIKSVLEISIREMYITMAGKGYSGIPLPH